VIRLVLLDQATNYEWLKQEGSGPVAVKQLPGKVIKLCITIHTKFRGGLPGLRTRRDGPLFQGLFHPLRFVIGLLYIHK